MTLKEVRKTLERLYGSNPWPKPLGLLRAAERNAAGMNLSAIAKECRTTKKAVQKFLSTPDPVTALFGSSVIDDKVAQRSRQMLGNLIVGRCAERIFVERYQKEAATTELQLSDLRESRSDTDYRLLNGKGRPVYRINIKFIGSQFRRAKELVGLEPADCFALATYKINAAVQKHDADQLPFLFIVVSVPGLSAEAIGGKAPSDIRDFLGLVSGPKVPKKPDSGSKTPQKRNSGSKIPKKRDIQDHVVRFLERTRDPGFLSVLNRLEHGNWYVLSARRADKLLRTMLFDRVYALRVPNFAGGFGGAELNMHFSLSKDLTPLDVYLRTLRESGYPRVTTLLERGEY